VLRRYELLFSHLKLLGKSGSQFCTVSDHNQNCLLVPMQIKQERGYGIGRVAIEIPSWFVTKEHGWLPNQSTGQCNTLFFSSREFGWTMIQAMTQSYLIQKMPRTFYKSVWGASHDRWNENVL